MSRTPFSAPQFTTVSEISLDSHGEARCIRPQNLHQRGAIYHTLRPIGSEPTAAYGVSRKSDPHPLNDNYAAKKV